MENNYYIYMYYITDTEEVFYIGKGKGNRYKEVKRRNPMFLNIYKKHFPNIAVRFYKKDLTNEEACELEKSLIKEYWNKGQCRANFHEGGLGGYTGNYDSPERSKKLSEFAKTRIGDKNPNFGKRWSTKNRKKQSKKLKKYFSIPENKEKLSKALTGRKIVWSEERRKNYVSPFKGKKMSKEQYDKMIDRECKYLYIVYEDDIEVYRNIQRTKMLEFCKNTYNISRSIVVQIMLSKWKPKFNKHKGLEKLKIKRIKRSEINENK